MLHLLPIRVLFQISLVLFGLAVVSAFYTGLLNPTEATQNVALILRFSSLFSLFLSFIIVLAWRLIPQFQRVIFPYLGGHWSGFVRFPEGGGLGERPVTLEAKHTPFGIKLILDSKESTSQTLSVQADRNSDFTRYRLYYIYLNEPKEGLASSRNRYRGVAIMRVETEGELKLFGDYFTETNRRGVIELVASRLHPWWIFWR